MLFMLPRARALGRRLDQMGMTRQAPQTLDFGDRSVSVRIGPRSRHDAPELLFSTPIAQLPSLRMRRPDRLDRLARRCGLARTATSGDADFDRRVLVSCDYRELASLLLRDAATRGAVLALFDAGARTLRYADGELSALFDAGHDPADLQPRAQQRAGLLAALARQPMGIVGALTPMTAFWPLRRRGLCVGSAALPLLALAACVALLDRYAPLDLQSLVLDALKRAPLWGLGALLPALIWLRGHPDSARLLPLALLASSLAAAPAAIAFHLVRNAGDAGAARDTVFAVTGSVKLSGAQGPTLRWSSTALQRRGLFGAPHSLSTAVSEAQWQSTPIARARLHARIAPGALGHPWLVSVTATSVREDTRPAAAPPPAPPAVVAAMPGLTLQWSPQLTLPALSGNALLAQAKALYEDDDLPAAGRQLDQALALFEREAAPASSRAEAHWYRARIYAALGNLFAAQQEADARAALTLAPGHSGATTLLADLLIGQRHYAEALQLWDLALARQPDHPFGHYRRAQLLAVTGALPEARSEAQDACRRGERAACDLADSF